MAAYAVALHQQSPDRTVTATLYFTAPGVAHRFTWSAGELDELKGRIESDVDGAVEALEQ